MKPPRKLIIINDPKNKELIEQVTKVVTEEKLAKLHTYIRGNHMTLPLACRTIGISWTFMRRAINRIPALREWIEEAVEEANARIATNLRKNAEAGHFPSQAYILDRTDEYAPPAQKMEQNITASQRVQTEYKGIQLIVKKVRVLRKKGKKKHAKTRILDVKKIEEEEVD